MFAIQAQRAVRQMSAQPGRAGYTKAAGRAPEVRHHTFCLFIKRACDFFDLFVFFAPDQMLFNPLQKGVILPAPACRGSEAPRRSIASQRVYGAESKDPGDACSQALFGAFRPQTTREIKKITASDRSGGICSSADRSWKCFAHNLLNPA